MESKYEIVKDPIHGYIKIYNHERKIIDTPLFQRLRRIKQNTAVHYSYPCATHTRFSHSLGVMHVSGLFIENLLDKIPNISERVKKEYYYKIRLWGLLHDIGHGPFSHTFDEVIFKPKFKTDHEKFGAKILKTSKQLPSILKPDNTIEIALDETAILFEVKSIEEWPLTDNIGNSDVSEKILYYICRGAYSADIMDFLLRDSYFTGAGYGNIDWKRLILTSTPIGDKLVLDPRGEEAFDSLLLARLFMFSTVYYHRTTRVGVKIISDFLKEAVTKINFSKYVDDVDNFSLIDEDSLLFNSNLLTLTSRKQLIERTFPYSRYYEKPVKIDLQITKGIDVSLTQQTREKLPEELQSIPDYAFFIDTPIITLNPYFGQQEDYIFLADQNNSEGYRPRRIWETDFGNLQKGVILLRLFIHDDFKHHEKEIGNAFQLRTEETHY